MEGELELARNETRRKQEQLEQERACRLGNEKAEQELKDKTADDRAKLEKALEKAADDRAKLAAVIERLEERVSKQEQQLKEVGSGDRAA